MALPLTNWGVFWRTYLLTHPLLALWVGYTNLTNPAVPGRSWAAATQGGMTYLLALPQLTLGLVVVLYAGGQWAYSRRRYGLGQALRLGVGLGLLLPLLDVVIQLAEHLVAYVGGGGAPAPYAFALARPAYWPYLGGLVVLGLLLVLPHWLFFRRLPSQRALRQVPAVYA